MANCTESSGVVPDFPWADACEAKVRTRPLVLIGGILPSVGSEGVLGG